MLETAQCIRAGDDTCAALGIKVRTHAPVLALCRKLVDAGFDPATPLRPHRGEVLSAVIPQLAWPQLAWPLKEEAGGVSHDRCCRAQ
jgi:hypothetical protein